MSRKTRYSFLHASQFEIDGTMKTILHTTSSFTLWDCFFKCWEGMGVSGCYSNQICWEQHSQKAMEHNMLRSLTSDFPLENGVLFEEFGEMPGER